jgi:hypothetical protein
LLEHKILLGCPISNRGWILPYYLRSIENLDFNKTQILLYFIVNNSNDNTLDLLLDFQSKNKNKYIDIIIERMNSNKEYQDARTEIRQEYGYKWLSILRNRLLDVCVKKKCTHFFSVDSDIVFSSDTLKRMLEHNVDIVSNLIYNNYIVSRMELKDYSKAYLCNNILQDLGNRRYNHIIYKTRNPKNNTYGELTPVDFTGAISLIKRDVCKKAKYDINTMWGEDEPFGYSARKLGFKQYCDISTFHYHCMDEKVLKWFIEHGWIEKL